MRLSNISAEDLSKAVSELSLAAAAHAKVISLTNFTVCNTSVYLTVFLCVPDVCLCDIFVSVAYLIVFVQFTNIQPYPIM